MLSLPLVQVLIQTGPIKSRQAVLVLGKMRWHPIQDHSDTILMKGIHKKHKILWCTVP